MDGGNTINETDAEELVVVELDEDGKPLAGEEVAKPDADVAEDDDGDERLATSEDDSEDEITANKRKRQQRRERRKRAELMSKQENEQLRAAVTTLSQRLQQLEGHAVAVNSQTIDGRLQQKLGEISQAETIMARAIAAGNGDDAAAALRIRDEAMAEAQALRTAKARIEQQAQPAQPQPTVPAAPQVPAKVVQFAKQWAEQNPWFDPAGKDTNSQLTRVLDGELAREGFDPATEEYWQELSRRVDAEIGEDIAPAKPRRNAPPVGGSREHAPQSTRKEIRVTPERKAAMIENGSWDDPVRRARVLKEFQEFDRRAASQRS